MEFDHYGSLIDHIHLRVADLDRSRVFYRAALVALGLEVAIRDGEDYFSANELWIDAADTAEGPFSRVHLAFRAKDRATVDAFHRAVLEAGGRDNGAPGERHYHPGYYAAFAFDPDGNNVEAVFHGDAGSSGVPPAPSPRQG